MQKISKKKAASLAVYNTTLHAPALKSSNFGRSDKSFEI